MWGIFAFHLLNISIDNPDPQPAHIPEDLTYNDQESILELVLETLLDFEEAIPESDDPDTEDTGKQQNTGFGWAIDHPWAGGWHCPLLRLLEQYIIHPNATTLQAFVPVFSPPPEA